MKKYIINKKQKINLTRLIDHINDLSEIGLDKTRGICRLALSKADKEARDFIVSKMTELGMDIFIDQIGNIIGLRKGEKDLPPVMTGSHIDTVSSGGKYDGAYGVLAGLEVINILNDKNIITKRPIAVAVFTNEEGIRYKPDMMGSLAYVGGIKIKKLLKTSGIDGTILGEELRKIGYAGDMKCGKIKPYGFIEIHVEQGQVLDKEKIPIGVVESLNGISWQEIIFNGEENHAGTTPLKFRKDAGLAAAKTVCYLKELVQSIGGNQLGTCGSIEFYPNNINVIPGQAKITVDLRNSDNKFLIETENKLNLFVKDISAKEGVKVEFNQLVRLDPVKFNIDIVKMIENTSNELGFKNRRMASGAGHDAQMMSKICSAAMIFIPSRDGISHNINEYSSDKDLETGVNLLLHSLVKLANNQ